MGEDLWPVVNRLQQVIADLRRRVEELERLTEPPSAGVDSSEEGGE
jgi:hypothetical protein